MRKFIISIMTVALLVCIAMAFTACGKKGEQSSENDYFTSADGKTFKTEEEYNSYVSEVLDWWTNEAEVIDESGLSIG